ncbi:hypothetical protein N182_28775 [Sinorhizobium sp. GL2]|nr:hypothetical protein N182_28775 [Sinorhizobium sp. GL2]
MNKQNPSTLSGFDKARLESFMDLETEVLELMHMSAITNNMVLDFLSNPDFREGKDVVFRISDDCKERMAFAIDNVNNRADGLATRFMTAFNGAAS